MPADLPDQLLNEMVGYNAARNARPGTAKAPQPKTEQLFSVLVPDGSGEGQKHMPPVGPYHVNHFICYFTVVGSTYTNAQGIKTAAELTYYFLRHFCRIFSEQNIARAQHGPPGLDAFEGSKTVEFTIGSNVGTFEHRAMGFMHPDWVAMSSEPPVTIEQIDAGYAVELTSFYGDTLKRHWDTVVEKEILSAATGADTDLSPKHWIFGLLPWPWNEIIKHLNKSVTYGQYRALLAFNRQHFLAGSRSWRVGYDTGRKEFFVETLTIERFSCAFYELAEKMHSTRNDVLALWDNQLNNFIRTRALRGYRFKPENPPEELVHKHGYEVSPVLEAIRHWAGTYVGLTELQAAYQAPDGTPVMQAIRDSHARLRVHAGFAGD